MPPKRKAATPPPKKSSKTKVGQTSIDNFFSSPSKQARHQANGHGDGKDHANHADSKNISLARSNSVISIVDSESEDEKSQAADEKVARDLQAQFDNEPEFEVVERKDKGKSRESEPLGAGPLDEDDGIEIVKEEVNVKEEGVNGSSSSKLHPMFGRRTSPSPPSPSLSRVNVKAEARDRKVSPINEISVKSETATISPAKITTTSAEPVKPIDFDVDQFIFRPGEIDISRWPKGRLPYSVLVGVYVQVSSTRSRLLIVRVLTK
jgi:DNA ligase-1